MSTSMARRSQRGVALLTAMIIVIIVAGMATAFLSLSFAQNKSTSNGTDREVALHIAEAGLEDSINKLTAYSAAWLKAGNTTPPPLVINGVTVIPDYQLIASQSIVKGTLSISNPGTVNGGTFLSLISHPNPLNPGDPVFTGPFAPTAPAGGYLITSSGTKGGQTRTIQVLVGAVDNSQLFKDGLFGDVQVDALGTFFSDGFDSSKGTYATQLSASTKTFNSQKYVDATGNIGSNGNIITNGSVTVVGNATPGPGGTSGPGGSIYGSTAPAISPQPLAPAQWNPPSSYSSPTVDSKNNIVTFSGPTSGTPTAYVVDSIAYSGKTTIQVTGQVTIYVKGTIDMNSQQTLQIGTVGNSADTSKLTVYQGPGANDITINGQAVSGTASADRFQLYSQTTGTIKFNGGSQVYAAVYAPAATFTNNGGNEFFGAMVAKSMKLTGTAAFHYDENLAKLATPQPDFKILSWVEIPNQ